MINRYLNIFLQKECRYQNQSSESENKVRHIPWLINYLVYFHIASQHPHKIGNYVDEENGAKTKVAINDCILYNLEN